MGKNSRRAAGYQEREAINSKAIIYTRKSVVRKGTDLAGILRQEEDTRLYCERNNLEVVGTYSEAESAFNGNERPQLDKALADLKAGKADCLVVWKTDRFSRRGIFGVAKLLEKADHCSLHSVTEQIDTRTVVGRIVLSVLAEIAMAESENISLRVSRHHTERASNGKRHSGLRPYGWNRDGTLRMDEVALIREAADSLLSGTPLFHVANRWNELGIPTVRGGDSVWHSNTIRNILRSPAMRGVRTHHGTEYPGDFDAIFTVEEHAKILACFNGTKTGHNWSLLGGILICGRCGNSMRAFGAAKLGDEVRYACHGCWITITRHIADEHIIAEYLRQATAWHEYRLENGTDQRQENQLAEDKAALAQLVHARFVDRTITDDAFQPSYAALAERIATSERQNTLGASLSTSVDPGADWQLMSVRERQTALRNAFLSIICMPVGKGKRVGGKRLEVTWRFGHLLEQVHRSIVT